MAKLDDCSKIKEPKDRMACIEANLKLVNASLETVARELREKIEKLSKAISNDIAGPIRELQDQALKRGDVVTISSVGPTKNDDRHQCLTWIDDMSAPRTQACGGGAAYAQGWRLNK